MGTRIAGRDNRENSTKGAPQESARCPVVALFRRFAVEVLVVRFRVGAGVVDDPIPVIRGRIELQRNSSL